MQFEFATATRILFGPGTGRELAPEAKKLGKRPMIVTGRNVRRVESLLAGLQSSGPVFFSVAEEPTTDLVVQGVALAKSEGCDVLIAIGGGSVMDAGKAIAGLVLNEGDLFDYLEVVGRGKSLEKGGIPFVAVPTTAGTGAEVTRNAVLGSKPHRFKVSLRSSLLLARLAIVDPELTFDLPAELTASTGLDALTQLIEPFVSNRANAMIDPLCVDGMRRVARSIRVAFNEPRNATAREEMSLASLFGGLALANAGLGAVHGFAAPIGGMFAAPHGAVCAALLPHVIDVNLRALRARQPRHPALARYDEVARLLTGDGGADAKTGIDWIRRLCDELRIPTLRHHGITSEDLPELVDRAAKASSMRANPIVLTPVELHDIISRAL